MDLREASPLKYRPDIDGLRAVAVLAVLIFHAFPKALPGGFIGVDIFFVISGYLISNIILGNLQKGTFSLKDFYVRRVRRIFPALLSMFIGCTLIGYWVLLPSEFRALGRHLAGGAGFISNLVLLRDAGYFDATADLKPFLHLWSLGIEEQFYIFWPLFLFWLWKISQVKNGLWIVTLISFSLCLVLTHNHPVLAFYALFTRFWELSIGGSLAYSNLRKPQSQSQNGAAWIGLLLIGLAVGLLHKNSVFPGWRAMLPTLGAGLLIWAGPKTWLNRKLLSHQWMVGIGLVSYPLYLWHWPLLSFLRITEPDEPALIWRWSAVAAASLLASCTYYLIERPLRHNTQRRWLTAQLCGLMLALFFGGMMIYFCYFPNSTALPPADDAARHSRTNKICMDRFPEDMKFNYCQSTSDKEPEIAVVGDSHAQAIYDGLTSHYQSKKELILLANSGCPPLLNTESFAADGSTQKNLCNEVYAQILKYLNQHSINTIFIVSRGPFYTLGDLPPKWIIRRDNLSTEEVFFKGLREFLGQLKARHIFFVLDNPTHERRFVDCYRPVRISASKCDIQDLVIPMASHQLANASYRRAVEKALAEFKNIKVLDPTPFFCNSSVCRQIKDDHLLYADKHHLSNQGGNFLIRYFVEQGQIN